MGARPLIDALFKRERKKKICTHTDVDKTLVNHTQAVKSHPVPQSSGRHSAGRPREVRPSNALLAESAVCWGFGKTDEQEGAACTRSKTYIRHHVGLILYFSHRLADGITLWPKVLLSHIMQCIIQLLSHNGAAKLFFFFFSFGRLHLGANSFCTSRAHHSSFRPSIHPSVRLSTRSSAP